MKFGKLNNIDSPPNAPYGYFGVVVKPKWIPNFLFKPFAIKYIRVGWLNMPEHFLHYKKVKCEYEDINWSEVNLSRWWFLTRLIKGNGRECGIRINPIYWCEILDWENETEY